MVIAYPIIKLEALTGCCSALCFRLPAGNSPRLRFAQELAGVISADDEYRRDIARRIAMIRAGKVPRLGLGEFSIPHGAGWRADAAHGHEWPCSYFSRVDYAADGKSCDVKVVWEASRLQMLVWLAEAAVSSSEPAARTQFAERFTELVQDWTANNPAGFGPNWVSSMEVAIRATNLAIAGSLLWSDLPRSEQRSLYRMMRWHSLYLRLFPEKSDVNGNHYLITLLGRVAFSALWDSERQFRMKIREFASEATAQFESEGGHVERSPAYHGLCTRAVALARSVGCRRLREDDIELRAVYDRAIQYCAHVASPAGVLALIGDNDSGSILDFADDPLNFAPELGLNSGDSTVPNRSTHAQFLYALSGRCPLTSGLAISATPGSVKSGFIRLSYADVHVLQRVGPKGLSGRAPHDHDDSQSIICWVQDREVLSERGTSSYTLSREQRACDLSSSSHNLTQVFDRERHPGSTGSVFLTARGAPVANAITVSRSAALTSIEFEADAQRCEIARSVEIRDLREYTILTVTDTLCSSDERRLISRFHLGPGIQARMVGNDFGVLDVDSSDSHTSNYEWSATTPQLIGTATESYDRYGQYGGSQRCNVLAVCWSAKSGEALQFQIKVPRAIRCC